jgi:hypothetical protein
MYDKYGIRTYPENCIQENSETDSENEIDSLPFKKATYANESDNPYSNENITSSLMEKVDNKINTYQQNYNKRNVNNPKVKKKKLKNDSLPNNFDSDIINENKISCSNPNLKRKKKLIKGFENKTGHNTNQKINLNKYFNITEAQLPKKSLKKYQCQYLDVENRDNFRVLSYRPEDYETDYNKENGKSKLIQIFKKQEASELFFPSKRTKSPPSPLNSNKKEKDKSLSFYQTPTLKFQSFFGSFMRTKNNKNSNQSKSTSKCKVNQLEDFNIEKLIEIGDNQSNKWNNILAFGNKIKTLKKKNRMKKLKTQENLRFRVNTDNDIDLEAQEIKQPTQRIQRIELDKKEYNALRSHNNYKKIVYHGQIKRKRNIQQNQIMISSSNENKEQFNKINPQNYTGEQNNQNINKNNFVIRTRRINTSANNSIGINPVACINKSSNSSKIKKKITKSIPRLPGNEFFYQSKNMNGNGGNTPNYNNRRTINRSNTNNGIVNKNSPLKTQPDKKIIYMNNKNINQPNKTNTSPVIPINNNNKFHYSIKHYNNIDNNREKNKYMNYSLMNRDKNIQKEKSKKNVLTEIKEIDYNDSNDNDFIEEKKLDIKKGVNTDDENFRKTQNISNGAINDIKKNSQRDYRNKRYYGYDDRHNLEGPINNHSVYVSVYTKKKE